MYYILYQLSYSHLEYIYAIASVKNGINNIAVSGTCDEIYNGMAVSATGGTDPGGDLWLIVAACGSPATKGSDLMGDHTKRARPNEANKRLLFNHTDHAPLPSASRQLPRTPPFGIRPSKRLRQVKITYQSNRLWP
jgi:hypothetical protein